MGGDVILMRWVTLPFFIHPFFYLPDGRRKKKGERTAEKIQGRRQMCMGELIRFLLLLINSPPSVYNLGRKGRWELGMKFWYFAFLRRAFLCAVGLTRILFLFVIWFILEEKINFRGGIITLGVIFKGFFFLCGVRMRKVKESFNFHSRFDVRLLSVN